MTVLFSFLAGCSTFVGSKADLLADLRPVPSARQAADDKYGPEVGESVLQAGGSLTSVNQSAGGSDTTTTGLQLLTGIGWFQSEWLEIGGQVIGNWSWPEGASDAVSVFFAPYANYNYRANRRLWLYAGPHVGLGYFQFGGDSATDFEFGLQGGARYWVAPRTSFFGELRYTAATVELGGIDFDIDTTQLLFGFSFVF